MKFFDIRVKKPTLYRARPEVYFKGRFGLPKFVYRTLRFASSHRLLSALFALLILLSIFIPILDHSFTSARYKLSAASSKLLGNVSPQMASKITRDDTAKQYVFNKEGLKKAPSGDPSKSVGTGDASKLYSAEFAEDAAKGIKIYDNVNQLSIETIPQFKTIAAKQDQNRLIYPADPHSAQLVYTVKANGAKEDIILNHPSGDSATFSYKLNLSDELEARLTSDGGVGVYSADPTLFGNISFGSDADQQKVEAARKNGKKTNLVFSIPAPIIKQTGKGTGNPTAKFELKDNILTIKAEGLKKASYPLSIDPTIVVTSSSDFRNGNNEGGIDFDDTNNQIKRGALTGGTVGSFSTGYITSGIAGQASSAYNGFVYVVGGVASTALKTTQYAAINGDGTLGAWQYGGALSIERYVLSSAIVTVGGNTYLYAMGGYGSATCGANTNCTTVDFAKINTDGSLGSWATTSSFTTARHAHTTVSDAGYLYVISGCATPGAGISGVAGVSCSTLTTSVQYAKPNSDGTIPASGTGAWTATTALPASRIAAASTVINDRIYVVGGLDSAGQVTATVYFASINTSTGTVGAWSTSTTAFPNSIYYEHVATVGGRLYVVGGAENGVVTANARYATLDGSGNVSSWTTVTSLPATNYVGAMVVDSSRLILSGGAPASGGYYAKTTTASVNGDGSLNAWVSSGATLGNRAYHSAAVYGGRIYLWGGTNGTGISTTYATLSSTGTFSNWQEGSPLNTFRYAGGGVAYNGYLYAVGGNSNVVTTEYAKIKPDGSLGTWTLASSLAKATFYNQLTVYNGYLYTGGGVVPGALPNTSDSSAATYYAQIKADGSLGAWTATISLTSKRMENTLAAYNGYLYTVGGCTDTVANPGTCQNLIFVVEYAPIKSDGTLGAWTSTTALSNSSVVTNIGVNNGYMYVVGGSSTPGNKVLYAPIYATGGLGGWSETKTLPTGVTYYGAVVFHNGYLINTGGFDNTVSPQVAYETASIAKIDPPGTISSFADSGNNFTTARWGHGSAVYNGYVYVVGGCSAADCSTSDGTTGFLADVRFAQIQSNGSLGAWNSTTAIPTTGLQKAGRLGASVVIYNGRLYVIGGQARNSLDGNGTFKTDVLYALIATGGGVINENSCSPWCTASNSFTTGRWFHTAVAEQGNIYVIGGSASGGSSSVITGTNSVQYATINDTGDLGGFSTTSQLGTGRMYFASTVAHGYVYAIGGYTGSSYLNSIERAIINSDGSLGSWTSTGNTAFTNARRGLGAYTFRGKLYLGAGFDGTTFYNDIQSADIATNGTIGSWSSSSNSFTTGRFGATMLMSGENLYIVGGCSAVNGSGNCTTFLSTTQYTTINNGGPGPTLGTWLTDSGGDFTTARITPAAVVNSGNIYVMGGTDGSGNAVNTAYYAPLNSDGTVGTWSKTSGDLPSSHDIVASVYNGYIYITGSSSNTNVYYAQPTSGGDITASGTNSWTQDSGTSYTTSRTDTNLQAYHGYLYIIGGRNGGGLADVQYAPLNSDGSVGTWASTNSYTTGRRAHQATIYNGYMYVFGGCSDNTASCTTSGAILGDSQYAPINSDGTLGTWKYTASLPKQVWTGGVTAQNGFMYLYGGRGDSTSAYHAPINADGSLGAWETQVNVFAEARNGFGTVAYNGIIYLTGGGPNTPNPRTTTYYTPLQSIPRKGTYSRLMDTDVDVTPTKGVVRGSSACIIDSTKSLSFQSALSASPTLGNSQAPSLTFESLFNLTVGSTKQARYFWVTLSLDDTQCATFPETSSQQSTITGFDLYYHANTARRLRGGKTFTGGSQQSLDAQP